MLVDLGAAAPFAALGLLAAVFVLFVLEWRPPDVTAFSGAINRVLCNRPLNFAGKFAGENEGQRRL